MAAETEKPRKQRRLRKRRRYTTAKRKEILKAVKEVGVVEAARRYGVPQTTVSNWLHRDATKVAKEQMAPQAADHGSRSKVARKRRGTKPVALKETTGPKAAEAPNAAAAQPGKAIAKSVRKRVARSYTPSEKAEALEHAATHGVKAASDELGISRFSIYQW